MITICSGDSGGPLTWYDKNAASWKVVGVGSFSSIDNTTIGHDLFQFCDAKYSGFAIVEHVLEWVQNIMNGNNCVKKQKHSCGKVQC